MVPWPLMLEKAVASATHDYDEPFWFTVNRYTVYTHIKAYGMRMLKEQIDAGRKVPPPLKLCLALSRSIFSKPKKWVRTIGNTVDFDWNSLNSKECV